MTPDRKKWLRAGYAGSQGPTVGAIVVTRLGRKKNLPEGRLLLWMDE
jgi:hypothetical protein